ncbi:amidase signature domain-containing protein [Exophiala viscosa]|uniref:Amidase signature domain-containing protein n=1 Tax=Exophiala viscosa TaxID=2486360 RepID=A0AAN6E820_9EURO|nr:amidase signature domain-containing protein [Exophiala viscosa]
MSATDAGTMTTTFPNPKKYNFTQQTSKWQDIAAKTQAGLKGKIPKEWLVPESILATKEHNVIPIFRTCGLLSDRELEITDAEDCTVILHKIQSKAWSAYEVAVAFCKRAAIAQQLINPLMDIDFEGGIQRARELDEHLASTGKVIGPLHGLPISFKDLTDVKNMRVTMGFSAWAELYSKEDAVVVGALRNAGAVVYCKTTLPLVGMMLETASRLFGRTLNAHNTRLSCGGSSGGEGALNGCNGAPIGIATDIGGSIRAPAAFNGLYAIRPTSRRFSYKGNSLEYTGQGSILSTIGPVGRSLRDIELICKVLNAAEPWLYDPAVMAKKWEPVGVPKKATIGVMYWDEVVMPHPPVQRALKTTMEKLKAAGHEVVEFKPYKQKYAWDLAFKLYYQAGSKFYYDMMAQTGEVAFPAGLKFIERARQVEDIHELIKLNKEQRQYQIDYLAHWNSTALQTSTGKPIDALLTPSFGSASYPHDYLPWWGYMTVWNLLDYPTFILPITRAQTSDVKDTAYKPANDLDQDNYDIYDPELFENAPVCLQLVGRSMHEEQLLSVAFAVDQAVKA